MRGATLVTIVALVALALGGAYGVPRLLAAEGADDGECEVVACGGAAGALRVSAAVEWGWGVTPQRRSAPPRVATRCGRS